MTAPPPEEGLHLQWFENYDAAVGHIDEYDSFLRRDPRFKRAALIVSRPRPEAGGYALYAIPRPGKNDSREEL